MADSAESGLSGRGASWVKCLGVVASGVAVCYAISWLTAKWMGLPPVPSFWQPVRVVPTGNAATIAALYRQMEGEMWVFPFVISGIGGLAFGGLWGGLVAGRRNALRSAVGGLLGGLVSIPLVFALAVFMNKSVMPAEATVVIFWEIACGATLGAAVGALWGFVAGGARFAVKALVAGAAGGFAGAAAIALAETFVTNSPAYSGVSPRSVEMNGLWALLVAGVISSLILRTLPDWRIGFGRHARPDALSQPPDAPHS